MPKSADEKRIKILESAKRRFAHYGMSKTTMAEIAQDLSFSKALLYYYFPDKNSLYCAVLEYVLNEQEEEIDARLTQRQEVDEAIMMILEKRMGYMKAYYNLFEYTVSQCREIPVDLGQVLITSLERQKSQVQSVLVEGIQTGVLKPHDTVEAAKLLLFALMGMRMVVIKDLKHSFFPAKEEFEEILNMQKKMAIIFIDGLRT